MEVDMERVGLIPDVVRYTIDGFFFFRLVSTENPVPDDKCSAVVFIDILLLAAVMHAMVGGCSEYILYCRVHFADIFRVHPELEQHRDLVGYEYYYRVEAYQRYGYKEDDLKILHPTEPKRHREVVLLAGMMRYVCGPEKPQPVRYIVCPQLLKSNIM